MLLGRRRIRLVCGMALTWPLLACQAPPRTNENLNAVLWTQTSVEFRASAHQAYTAARHALGEALADATWSASLEQQQAGGYEGLPPAVVLDVDETVLDNSPYQAALVRDDAAFTPESWNAWVDQARARPVPGALEFTRQAAEQGVAVVYVTNREHSLEAATRRNLQTEGFPLAQEAQYDALLMKNEQDDWGSDKGSRRRVVAERFRILLLLGDNLGDFLSDVRGTLQERDQRAGPHAAYWGSRWIVLPNPQYGSWDAALYGFDYKLSRREKLRQLYAHLHY